MMAPKRNRAWAWRKLRQTILSQEPLCRLCMAKGRIELAVEVDHIVPLHKGGAELDASNCRPICKPCHVDVTNAEQGLRVKVRVGLDGWPVID